MSSPSASPSSLEQLCSIVSDFYQLWLTRDNNKVYHRVMLFKLEMDSILGFVKGDRGKKTDAVDLWKKKVSLNTIKKALTIPRSNCTNSQTNELRDKKEKAVQLYQRIQDRIEQDTSTN
jgi:hypothetical protein